MVSLGLPAAGLVQDCSFPRSFLHFLLLCKGYPTMHKISILCKTSWLSRSSRLSTTYSTMVANFTLTKLDHDPDSLRNDFMPFKVIIIAASAAGATQHWLKTSHSHQSLCFFGIWNGSYNIFQSSLQAACHVVILINCKPTQIWRSACWSVTSSICAHQIRGWTQLLHQNAWQGCMMQACRSGEGLPNWLQSGRYLGNYGNSAMTRAVERLKPFPSFSNLKI